MRKIIILFLLISQSLSAEVISKANNGFSIQIETIVNSSQKKSYKQFLRVGEWWNSEHTWFGDSKDLKITPKVGGCFCEHKGKKQAIHMTMSYVDPNSEIRMTGGLGPLQGMGLHGGMTWKFEKINENKTKIIHSYNVSGYSKDGLESLAPIVDSVQQIQVDSLAKLLNSRS